MPEIFVRESKDFVKLQFAGDTVVCTPEHPFFVAGHWVDAEKLKTGDSLFALNGYKVCIISERCLKPIPRRWFIILKRIPPTATLWAAGHKYMIFLEFPS